MALNYVNPGWTNDDEPYIDADNLNGISDNLEEACDLIGNETMGTTATTITGAIKELAAQAGSTPMGTLATTITGAIAEHGGDINTIKNKLGTFRSVDLEIGYTDGESVLAKVQRAYASTYMPKGVPFVANVHSGSYFLMVGYWYSGSNYGFCYVQNFTDAHFVELDNGTWKITSNYAASTASSVNIKIGVGQTYNGTIGRSGKVRVYNFYYYSDNPVGTITLNTALGIVSASDMPRYEETTAVTGYTAGNYSGTSYPMSLMISTGSVSGTTRGGLYLRGKVSDIALCREFRGQLVWLVD